MKYNGTESKQPHKIDKLLDLADQYNCENDDLLYCSEEGRWYIWEDNYYKPKLDIEIERYLIDDERVQYMNLTSLNQFIRRLAQLKYKSLNDFNAQEILDFKNGIFNMKTMEFKDHDKKYISTIRIPYDYNEWDDCPLWEKFLQSSLEGNESRIGLLQEFMGYCLGRDNSFHKALILLGEGRNGKGTTFHVINKLLGEVNVSSLGLGEMNNKETLSSLVNKLVNIDADTNTKATGYEANFRRITAGDRVTARYLYGNVFSFVPYVKMIVGANDLPHIADKTHGFYDRLLIIPYEVSFAGREDHGLKGKLEKELTGILNWCIEGRKRLYKRGRFETNNELNFLIKQLKRENNPVEAYVDDRIKFHDDYSVAKAEVYRDYEKWCDENGHKKLSKIKFGKEFFRICRGFTAKNERRYWDIDNAPIWTNLYIVGTQPEPSTETGALKDMMEWED